MCEIVGVILRSFITGIPNRNGLAILVIYGTPVQPQPGCASMKRRSVRKRPGHPEISDEQMAVQRLALEWAIRKIENEARTKEQPQQAQEKCSGHFTSFLSVIWPSAERLWPARAGSIDDSSTSGRILD